MKKIIKIIIWTVVLAGLGYLTFAQLSKNKEKIEADAKLSELRNEIIPVVTTTVSKETWEGSFDVAGSFAPYQQVAVMSEATGKIVQLNVQNGSQVQAGATIAAIDNDLLKIQLETTRTNLSKAENDFARLSKLLGEGGVTQQQLDDAKLGIDNLKSQIRTIEKQIAMSYVRAPISGVITNKMVEKGSLVSPGMKLADLTNINRLKMQVYLTEEQVANVKNGRRIQLKADLFPGKNLDGIVTFIDVNTGLSRRYLVEIEIDNPGGAIKAGMNGTAYFEGGAKKEVLAVPRESIVGSLQDARVYVVDGDKAVLRKIETGAVFGNKVHVRNGLSEGEKVVVSGQINLEDGMTIAVSQ